MPHDYLRFISTFGFVFNQESVSEDVARKMNKYINVFMDMLFYEIKHLLHKPLNLAIACVACT